MNVSLTMMSLEQIHSNAHARFQKPQNAKPSALLTAANISDYNFSRVSLQNENYKDQNCLQAAQRIGNDIRFVRFHKLPNANLNRPCRERYDEKLKICHEPEVENFHIEHDAYFMINKFTFLLRSTVVCVQNQFLTRSFHKISLRRK